MPPVPEIAGTSASDFMRMTASSERLTNGSRPVIVRNTTTPTA